MSFEMIELPLACPTGHTGKFAVTLAHGAGWDLRAELDNNVVAIEHCHDWHQLERRMVQIETELWSAQSCQVPQTETTQDPQRRGAH